MMPHSVFAAVSTAPSYQGVEADVPSTFTGRGWKVIGPDGAPIDLHVVAQALKEQEQRRLDRYLDGDDIKFYKLADDHLRTLTAKKVAQLYGGCKAEADKLTGVYEMPLYDPNFDVSKTRKFAATMVGFGINNSDKSYNSWINTFSEDMMYVVSDQSFVVGLNKVKEFLKKERQYAPPLNYTVYDLSCKGNMATLLLGNNLSDGSSFLLAGYTFFNTEGKAILNIDTYNRFRASLEVVRDIVTQPQDAKKVASKVCVII
jgi:hypothetical protein